MPGSAREHSELGPGASHFWVCVPLTEAVQMAAEAVAAERARLRALVEGIQVAASLMERHAANDPLVLVRVSRETFRDLIVQPLAAVLAALEEPDAR